MALGSGEAKTFLGINEGKITQRVKEGDSGAEPRVKTDGTIIYERRFGYITGLLTGISIKSTPYGTTEIKSFVLQLSDVGENYQLEINYDSAYAKSFLKSILNPEVDFSQNITLTPWYKVQNDKKKSAIYLSQNGKQIDWYFTKDNPNGLPELKEVTLKGKVTYDDYDQMQFFEKQISEKILPKLSKPSTQTSFEYAKPEDTNEAPGADDLPF